MEKGVNRYLCRFMSVVTKPLCRCHVALWILPLNKLLPESKPALARMHLMFDDSWMKKEKSAKTLIVIKAGMIVRQSSAF